MIIKKEDHNTGVSDGIKKFFIENLIKNFLKSTLLKILKTLARILKRVPYQGT